MPSVEVVRIVDELNDADQRIAALRALLSPEQLLDLARYYNWGDGMAVPQAISDHPACDLGVALHLFELAEGTVFLISPERDWSCQHEWAEFCRVISQRILSGHYATGIVPFVSAFSPVQCLKLRRLGIPEVFFSPLVP
jgi:hypothetical protein